MHTNTKTLIRLAAFAGLIVPPTALAAIILQLPADAVAGLGFDLLVSGGNKNEQIAIQMETPDNDSVALRGKTDSSGNAALAISGNLSEHAGTYTFTSDDGAEASLDVVADAIDPELSTIDVWTPRIDNDGDDAASVTVTLRDQYGNPLPGRIVTLVSGRGDDDVGSETNETDDQGEQHFSVRTYDPGTITLRAIDLLSGIPLFDSATIRSGDTAVGGHEDEDEPESRTSGGSRFFYAAQVGSFDVLDHFEIIAPSTLEIGEEAQKITIRAVDQDNNTVEDYTGTVVFSSTDKDATLPNFGRYTFKSRDLGKKDFPLVLEFEQSGEQTFRVEDENDRTIYGDATIDVTGDGSHGSAAIVITSPKDGDTVNGTTATISGTGPIFTDLIAIGGAADVKASTDSSGNFTMQVPLRSDQRDYQIRIQDEAQRHDPATVLLRLDADAPAIGTVTFTPAEPAEGEKVLVVVKSEPGLSKVLLLITQRQTGAVQEVALTAQKTASGTYQAFFTAPQPDQYQPKVLATDRASNTAELRTTLTVTPPSLPIVTGVRAEAGANSVTVTWEDIEGDVEGYRVYVGASGGTFDYSLDTKERVTRATVAGLTGGKTFYFSVTAVDGDRESRQKSAVVSAQVLGLTLNAAAKDHALDLTWSEFRDEKNPLSHFLLEYSIDEKLLGTQSGEKRLLNPELREYTMVDLMEGVEYVVRLTPVTRAGKVLKDVSATVRAKPTGTGFHPGAGDPIPYDPTTQLPHIAPETPGSGIPQIAFWMAAAVGIVGVWMHLKRKAEKAKTAAFLANLPSVR